jgi:hypothetical protein
LDIKISEEFIATLIAIADQLSDLQRKHPEEFKYICLMAQATSEMSLGDAKDGLNWACDFLVIYAEE